jgi:hypothetical protein
MELLSVQMLAAQEAIPHALHTVTLLMALRPQDEGKMCVKLSHIQRSW